ncbi:MAG TPA: hypothetical protein VI322_05765 [Candidatus Saccharimonadia bacterium]
MTQDHESNPESAPESDERLTRLGREYDLMIGAVPGLKSEIVERTMGQDRYAGAEERLTAESRALNNLSEAERAAYYKQEKRQTLLGYAVNADPLIGELEAVRSWVDENEIARLEGGIIGYGEGANWQTTPEHTQGPDDQPIVHTTEYRVRDGKIVAVVQTFNPYDDYDARQAQYEQEAELGINAQPVPLEQAEHLAAVLRAYHQQLLGMSQLEQADLRAQLGLGELQ